eukprot:scaffold22590_cov46-Attheya_sp.AAC.3
MDSLRRHREKTADFKIHTNRLRDPTEHTGAAVDGTQSEYPKDRRHIDASVFIRTTSATPNDDGKRETSIINHLQGSLSYSLCCWHVVGINNGERDVASSSGFIHHHGRSSWSSTSIRRRNACVCLGMSDSVEYELLLFRLYVGHDGTKAWKGRG